MTSPLLVLSAADLEGLLSVDDHLDAARDAFAASADGRALPPGLLHLDPPGGELHVKLGGFGGVPFDQPDEDPVPGVRGRRQRLGHDLVIDDLGHQGLRVDPDPGKSRVRPLARAALDHVHQEAISW